MANETNKQSIWERLKAEDDGMTPASITVTFMPSASRKKEESRIEEMAKECMQLKQELEQKSREAHHLQMENHSLRNKLEELLGELFKPRTANTVKEKRELKETNADLDQQKTKKLKKRK